MSDRRRPRPRTRRGALRAGASLVVATVGALAGCSSRLGPGSDGGAASRTTTDGAGSATPDASVASAASGGEPATDPPDRRDPRDPPTVPIPGGTYTIGSPERETTRPVHEVALDRFRIDRHEVTNRAFAAFLNALDVDPVRDAPAGSVPAEALPAGERSRFIEGPEGAEERPLVALDDEHCRIGIEGGRFRPEAGYGDHPATEVTWIGARAFAGWRGGRLPTEVEWEAAARGREGRTYPWGEAEPTPERAVYGRGSGETAPVGSHPAGATPRGVVDLAGNVSEWTSTLFRPYPYRRDGREDPAVDGERVTRGGAHVFFGAADLVAYQRAGFSREFDRGHRHIGFRCVEPADGPGAGTAD